MPVYALVAFVIIGVFAGWLGGMLLKGRGLRPIGNMIIGSIGAIAGGTVISSTGLSAPGAMGSLFAAAISAAVFLALLGIKQRYRADRR